MMDRNFFWIVYVEKFFYVKVLIITIISIFRKIIFCTYTINIIIIFFIWIILLYKSSFWRYHNIQSFFPISNYISPVVHSFHTFSITLSIYPSLDVLVRPLPSWYFQVITALLLPHVSPIVKLLTGTITVSCFLQYLVDFFLHIQVLSSDFGPHISH